MKNLWRRLLRIREQSRIRWSAGEFKPQEIRLGDRLEIESRIWRVERVKVASEGAIFQLRSWEVDQERLGLQAEEEGGCSQAILRPAQGAPWMRWILERGGQTQPVVPGQMLHFPVSQVESRG